MTSEDELVIGEFYLILVVLYLFIFFASPYQFNLPCLYFQLRMITLSGITTLVRYMGPCADCGGRKVSESMRKSVEAKVK